MKIKEKLLEVLVASLFGAISFISGCVSSDYDTNFSYYQNSLYPPSYGYMTPPPFREVPPINLPPLIFNNVPQFTPQYMPPCMPQLK